MMRVIKNIFFLILLSSGPIWASAQQEPATIDSLYLKFLEQILLRPGDSIVLQCVWFSCSGDKYDTIDHIEPISSIAAIGVFAGNKKENVFELDVYSDQQGNDQYNLQLTQNRANSIKSILSHWGADNSQVIAVGKGETNKFSMPKGHANLEDNYRKNRVIVFKMIEKSGG